MNTRTRASMLTLAVDTSAVAAATAVLIAQSASTSSVPVCVKSNGQIRVLMGANAMCDTSEQRTDWVIGGEVTNITLGQGLIGDRQGGTVQLAVDPSLLRRGGRVFSGFNDGPVPFPAGFPNEDVARLELPAGNFAVFAKLTRRRASAARNASHSSDTCTDSGVHALNPWPASLGSS